MRKFLLLCIAFPLLLNAQVDLEWANVYSSTTPTTYLSEMISSHMDSQEFLYIVGGYSSQPDFNPYDQAGVAPQRGIRDIVVQKLKKTTGEVVWIKSICSENPRSSAFTRRYLFTAASRHGRLSKPEINYSINIVKSLKLAKPKKLFQLVCAHSIVSSPNS